MKFVTHSVFVSVEQADDLDLAALKAALASGVETGSLKVKVSLGKHGTKTGYHLTGRRLVVTADDLLDDDSLTLVNKQLSEDLGTIGAVREDDPQAEVFSKGDPVTVDYVLNHDGLPLAYNKAIRGVFAKENGGRRSLVDENLALVWAITNVPNVSDVLKTENGKAKIIEMYRSSLE